MRGERSTTARPPAAAPAAGARAAGGARGVDVAGRHAGMAGRTALISGLTLVSRLLGYAREVLSAWLFGDRSGIFDAFITAWRVPNLFRRFLGEGALATALQTSLTEVDAERGEEAGRALFAATAAMLAKILLALCALVMLLVWLTPDEMPLTGFAWLGADPGAVRELTVRVMPFVVLTCLAAAAAGALNVRGHFATPALGPAVLNVVWIAALSFVALTYGAHDAGAGGERTLAMVRVLAWGVLAAGLLQLVVMIPALRRYRLLGRGPADVETRARARRGAFGVLKKSAPLALGAAVYQVNVMVDGLMAEGLLPNGAPTLHYYASRLQQLPMALIAMAATAAVFPALAAYGQQGRRDELKALHDRTQRGVCFLALPATVGLVVLAQPIIAVSFERGAFGPEGVQRAAAALRVLALAILPAGAAGLVARAYYALGDFKTPVLVSSAMLVLNVVLNVVFLVGCGMDIDGLALATAISSAGNVVLLLPGLRRRFGLPRAPAGFRADLARSAVAALACGTAAHGARVFARGLGLGRAAALVLAILAAALVFALCAELLGVRAWREARARLAHRLGSPRSRSGRDGS